MFLVYQHFDTAIQLAKINVPVTDHIVQVSAGEPQPGAARMALDSTGCAILFWTSPLDGEDRGTVLHRCAFSHNLSVQYNYAYNAEYWLRYPTLVINPSRHALAVCQSQLTSNPDAAELCMFRYDEMGAAVYTSNPLTMGMSSSVTYSESLIDQEGNIHVLTNQAGNLSWLKASPIGTLLLGPICLETDIGTYGNMDFLLGLDNNVHICFADVSGGQTDIFYIRMDTSGVLQDATQQVTFSSEVEANPAVGVFPSGEMALAYREQTGQALYRAFPKHVCPAAATAFGPR